MKPFVPPGLPRRGFRSARWLVPVRDFLHFGLLRAASLLVPARQRSEWFREWRGELWHVRQACAATSDAFGRGDREVTAFCLGAFDDALCLRRGQPDARAAMPLMDGTARQCLAVLTAILAVSYAMALLLPGVRAERSLWSRKVNPNLILIERRGVGDDTRASISAAQFRSWQGRTQRYFDGFAFYRVTREPVRRLAGSAARQTALPWAVAHASPNFFALLGLPVRFADEETIAEDGLPQLILSEAVWKREFAADPHVTGSVLLLAGRAVRVAGVALDGTLDLPGAVDAWMQEPSADSSAERESAAGYVVAHLNAAGAAEVWTPRVHIGASALDGTEDDLLGLSLQEWSPATESIYLFGLMLALLALPAITSVSLGEYCVNSPRTSGARQLLRWSFLGAKIALLLPSVHFISLDLGYSCPALGRESAIYIQLASCFSISLFGLCWVLKDQRQRCPVCMRRVVHPAQVGQASRTFLDWNGTEMMCRGGHTLLHVPALPTSWFSTQRWLYLDTSWGFLFAGSTRPLPLRVEFASILPGPPIPGLPGDPSQSYSCRKCGCRSRRPSRPRTPACHSAA